MVVILEILKYKSIVYKKTCDKRYIYLYKCYIFINKIAIYKYKIYKYKIYNLT